MAPSTLGTFLRIFTFGLVRLLDALSEELLCRAWRFGAGPSDAPMTIDIDSTIQQVYGKQKQGSAYGYTKVLGQCRSRGSSFRPRADRSDAKGWGHRSAHPAGRLGVPLAVRGQSLP
jgi:hypothetical protein